jgi:DNA segregation ATPase FtsK/SpoIIIE, S-DNA-T family
MARARSRAAARARFNLEIAGIAAIGVAVICGMSLAFPHLAGSFGGWTASMLRRLFGGGAGLFPVLLAILGAIVFLELNVTRMIAAFGCSAMAYFLIFEAALGAGGAGRGGAVGANIWWALHALLGTFGSWTVLALAVLSLTLWLTNLSLKQLVGRALLFSNGLNLPKLSWPKLRLPKLSLPKLAWRAPSSSIAPTAPEPAPLFDVASTLPVLTPERPAVEPRRIVEPPPQRIGEPEERSPRAYRLPDLAIFDPPPRQIVDDSNRAHILEDTLSSFGVGAKVVHIERGPSITRYELRPDRGIKVSRIASLADDLALALAATSVRIEAPIPGKSAVGIEVPNQTVSIVAIREILDALPNRGQVPPLWMALGKDLTGRPVFGDLSMMPHLLVAGATGSGKSVCLNTIIASLLSVATPNQVQLLMIDPKRVELPIYNGIPHLIKEVITDPRLAAGALLEMTKEMDGRYERFAKAGVRKIEEYNLKYPNEKLPFVVIVIDELADLMLVAPAKVETTIMRLAQLARATGIHLIVSTQRPSVDVITGLIKANIPSRISFAVSSQTDSRVILDMNGAERLLGRGDMLYLPIDAPKPIRAQGALINPSEVARLVEFWARQSRPDNLLDVDVTPVSEEEGARRDVDPLCYDAARFIIETNYASTAQLQSQFSIGHPRAVRVMKQLEDFKVVGAHEGTKPRKILIGLGELELMAARLCKDDGGQQNLFASG